MATSRANRELTTDDKTEVVKYLQDRMSLGKLPRGSIKAAAAALNLNRKTVSGIGKACLTQGSSPSKKAGRVGRKLRYTPEHVTQLVQELPQEERSTMRDIATATGLTMGTICRNLKSGTLERRSSRLKPLLTDEKRTERIDVSKRVVIQHDNASPHASVSDGVLDAIQAHFADGWEFRVRRQPPNSPDLNVLDLGFFASIQALQYKSVSRTVDDVIRSTLAAFDELSEEKLDNVFLTLQAVMRIVLEHNGDNHFRLPHLHKEAMRRAGTLVANVACPVSLL
ncbi:hypothetical protein DYB26_004980 [Aphanomyces astaci]|uniref:Tc1-like transposase DDE domain-containing protein n=1 Tax=Aphanomyces astaci TaxID=112090 RepID=A0A418F0P3_APHAT|nr:hypothetical protein DYB26_004980 [Aphanomyces astaci]